MSELSDREIDDDVDVEKEGRREGTGKGTGDCKLLFCKENVRKPRGNPQKTAAWKKRGVLSFRNLRSTVREASHHNRHHHHHHHHFIQVEIAYKKGQRKESMGSMEKR